MLREITYSSIRAGSYEPIKVALGGTDRHHTTMAIKMKAGAVAGMKLHNSEFPIIATAELDKVSAHCDSENCFTQEQSSTKETISSNKF